MEMKNESAPKVYENMAYGVVQTDNTVYRAPKEKEEEEESWCYLIFSCLLCR